jgi:hypothetical protein
LNLRKTAVAVTVSTLLAAASLTAPAHAAPGAAVPSVKKEKVDCGQGAVKVTKGTVLRSLRWLTDEETGETYPVSTYDEAVENANGSWSRGETLGKRTPGTDFYLTTSPSKIDFRGNVYTLPARTIFETRCYGRSAKGKPYPALAAISAVGERLTVSVRTSRKNPGGFLNALLLANGKAMSRQRITLKLTRTKAIVRSNKRLTITPQVQSNRATVGKCFYPLAGSVDVQGRTKVLKK